MIYAAFSVKPNRDLNNFGRSAQHNIGRYTVNGRAFTGLAHRSVVVFINGNNALRSCAQWKRWKPKGRVYFRVIIVIIVNTYIFFFFRSIEPHRGEDVYRFDRYNARWTRTRGLPVVTLNPQVPTMYGNLNVGYSATSCCRCSGSLQQHFHRRTFVRKIGHGRNKLSAG